MHVAIFSKYIFIPMHIGMIFFLVSVSIQLIESFVNSAVKRNRSRSLVYKHENISLSLRASKLRAVARKIEIEREREREIAKGREWARGGNEKEKNEEKKLSKEDNSERGIWAV